MHVMSAFKYGSMFHTCMKQYRRIHSATTAVDIAMYCVCVSSYLHVYLHEQQQDMQQHQ